MGYLIQKKENGFIILFLVSSVPLLRVKVRFAFEYKTVQDQWNLMPTEPCTAAVFVKG